MKMTKHGKYMVEIFEAYIMDGKYYPKTIKSYIKVQDTKNHMDYKLFRKIA